MHEHDISTRGKSVESVPDVLQVRRALRARAGTWPLRFNLRRWRNAGEEERSRLLPAIARQVRELNSYLATGPTIPRASHSSGRQETAEGSGER